MSSTKTIKRKNGEKKSRNSRKNQQMHTYRISHQMKKQITLSVKAPERLKDPSEEKTEYGTGTINRKQSF